MENPLRWWASELEPFTLAAESVVWRAEFDKMRKEQTTPLSADGVTALKATQRARGAIRDVVEAISSSSTAITRTAGSVVPLDREPFSIALVDQLKVRKRRPS